MEWLDILTKILAIGFLLSLSWNASEGKRYAKEARDQLAKSNKSSPGKVIACPYGYGECEAFPLGVKPCLSEEETGTNPADHMAGGGDDEAPPVP